METIGTSDIAKELGVKPQTVRNYAAQFGAQMGAIKTPRGLWVFAPSHIATLAKVKDTLKRGHTYAEVAQMLQNGTLELAPIPEENNGMKALMGAIIELAAKVESLEERLASALALPPAEDAAVFAQTHTQNTLAKHGQTLECENEALSAKVEVLKVELEEARAASKWRYKRRMKKAAA